MPVSGTLKGDGVPGGCTGLSVRNYSGFRQMVHWYTQNELCEEIEKKSSKHLENRLKPRVHPK